MLHMSVSKLCFKTPAQSMLGIAKQKRPYRERKFIRKLIAQWETRERSAQWQPPVNLLNVFQFVECHCYRSAWSRRETQ